MYFEAKVQACFVVLMLTGGFVPCMRPDWPIKKIKLQGRYTGYDTDDLIVFVQRPDGKEEGKLLGQIKHTIGITANDITFGAIIADAWRDFNNVSLFSKGKDVIALITGLLSTTDVNDTRTILEWARYSENAEDYYKKVYQTRFSSEAKRRRVCHVFCVTDSFM